MNAQNPQNEKALNQDAASGKKRYQRALRPLSMHMGLALAEYHQAQHNPDNAADDLTEMVRGIRLYQDHPFCREMPALPEIWRCGAVSLQYCKVQTKSAAKTSILLVPSLINKSIIFDLLPDKSFVRFLSQCGFDVYLLDWGQPVTDPGAETMTALVMDRLVPAMKAVERHVKGAPFHTLGYCMGGMLLTAGAVHYRGDLRSIIYLASPWDFHDGAQILTKEVQAGLPAARQAITSKGYLPADWIQSVFAAVNRGKAIRKFKNFAAMNMDEAPAHLFVAVEDWLNDGLDLPGCIAESCLHEWYGENRPAKGCWKIGGRIIDPAAITCPALVVASARDRLVPAESSCALLPHLVESDILQPDCGHIGMMAGQNADTNLWQPLVSWLRRH